MILIKLYESNVIWSFNYCFIVKENLQALKSINGESVNGASVIGGINNKKDALKSENEKDLDKKVPRPMVIDLELQKIDSCGRRTCNCMLHFLRHYCKDKLSCPLMIIIVAAIVFVVIGYLIPYK